MNNKRLCLIPLIVVLFFSLSSCSPNTYSEEPITEDIIEIPISVPIIKEPIFDVEESNIPEETEPQIQSTFTELLEENIEIVGWISIEGTDINFPVMQTVDNEKYLITNFYDEYSVYGTPFLDYRCSILPQSQNLLLYGHATRSGALFGQLRIFLDTAEIPTIRLTTLYDNLEYTVFSAFTTTNETEDTLVYTQFDFANYGDFQTYVAKAKKLSEIESDIKPDITDNILTIQTCSYGDKDEKLIVVAVQN
ncbi:MAG: class B sortase [Oscillospiraceae bacterium]|nr:class B sortase [Oscillospiraceae bacterium]